MPNMNKVILAGNLTRDPELKNLPSGATVCSFALAINRRWTGKDGQKKEEVAFVECTAWGRVGELIAQYLGKGKPALIEGHLTQDRWEDQRTNQKRSRLYVTVENVQFLGSRDGNGEAPAPARQQAPSEEQYEDPDVPF